MALTILPDPPSRADPANFAARGDAFMAALPTFVSEFNAQVPNVVAGDQGITGQLTVQGDASIAASLSAWGTSLAALQLGVSAFVSGRTGTEVCNIGSGAYDDGTNWKYSISSNYATRYQQDSGIHKWFTAPTGTAGSNVTFSESMRIDTSGNLLVGLTSGPIHRISKSVTPDTGQPMLSVDTNNTTGTFTVYSVSGATGSANAANSAVKVGRDGITSRSINASGTINASGADYAEYEHNNGLKISKGSLVGFKQDGTLTDVFAEAIRFGVKSTDPSYVGGDVWGNAEAVGVKPDEPADATPEQLAEYQSKLAEFETKLEQARQLVDRIAYSGKVPCNVHASSAIGYIIAAADTNGKIIGKHVVDCTFDQYKLAVGRVNRLLPDNRCEIAVMVH